MRILFQTLVFLAILLLCFMTVPQKLFTFTPRMPRRPSPATAAFVTLSAEHYATLLRQDVPSSPSGMSHVFADDRLTQLSIFEADDGTPDFSIAAPKAGRFTRLFRAEIPHAETFVTPPSLAAAPDAVPPPEIAPEKTPLPIPRAELVDPSFFHSLDERM